MIFKFSQAIHPENVGRIIRSFQTLFAAGKQQE
jgi:hypothetical protein